MFRLSLVSALVMVISVNQVQCSFGDFLIKLPLKLSDGVTSLVRMFEENFKYHSPKARQSYKRSDLLSKIQNSFKAEETTTAPPPITIDPEFAVQNIDDELKKYQPFYSKRVAQEDLEPVVPLSIPYIPQPRSGLQEFFRSVQPLENFEELSVKDFNTEGTRYSDPQFWQTRNANVESIDPEITTTTNKDDEVVIDFKKFRVKISSDLKFFW